MKVLVACEESQEVCKAFRDKGHEAYSCDIQDCSGGHPEWHIKGDVLPLLNGRCHFITMDGAEHYIPDRWDLIIAHPPCTYLSNAGARWLWSGHKLNYERYTKGVEAKEFFMSFWNADCPRICIENPVPTDIVSDYKPFVSSGSYSKTHDPKYKGASRKGGSAKSRSKTFPGIAKAMAEQWG